jgi:glucose 1-dehydrogenase
MNPNCLDGKVAVVTGGSRGIGRATAISLAQAGADVAINFYQALAEAEQVAAAVRAQGRRALLVQGDVADQTMIEGLIRRTAEEFGRVDIAVSNAVYSDREPFFSAKMEGFRRTIDVTMWGAFYLLRAAAQQMIAQGGGGSIVMISSPHAFIPVPNAMPYNMAKAATDHMARTAATELLDHRIRVNIVHPGWVDTPGERKFASEEDIAVRAAKLPWGRMATPEEIARGVVFLCDPASEYMTGSALLIDGGNTLPWWARSGMAVPP